MGRRIWASTKTIRASGTAPANTPGSVNRLGNTYVSAFDGDANTFFDAVSANGNYLQLDQGSANMLTALAYAPRAGSFEAWMIGGIFEPSNSSTFASCVVTLYTVKLRARKSAGQIRLDAGFPAR